MEIGVNAEAADRNGLPIILTPQLTGENDGELQYHWTMKVEVTGVHSSDVLATDEITLVGVEGMYSLK